MTSTEKSSVDNEMPFNNNSSVVTSTKTEAFTTIIPTHKTTALGNTFKPITMSRVSLQGAIRGRKSIRKRIITLTASEEERKEEEGTAV
ncbi:hypothetical protein Pmani_034093 [Petrolisthes manimaculis]|uniref:Uncharacterized protein n=1 Tax=Petrolisthes manimaculis TaxID=1843537 RepID=A0AAE1NNG8_9EUCA|nr:hypothetical protein Pmani_034093 [Petrolisthes manimaculis]